MRSQNNRLFSSWFTLAAIAAAVAVPRSAVAQAAPAASAAPAPAPPAATATTTAQTAPPPPELPPPPPPPWTSSSATAASGTTLTPQSPETTPTPTAASASAANGATDRAQDRRISELEHQLAEARYKQLEKTPAVADADDKMAWLQKLNVSGFLQPQLVWSVFDANASPNATASGLPAGIGSNDLTAKADGTTTNPDFFRLRRARLRTEFAPSDYARLVFEIDPTPVGGQAKGPGTIARNVEAVGIAHWSRDVVTEFGMGIFKLPFGYEVPQSDADRVFIERSWGEQNMTPGEFDTGARAYTTALEKKLTAQVAFVNGQTQGEKNFAVLPDLNKGKDFVGRVAYDLGIVNVGVSGYYGQGQAIDAAAFRFKNFIRKAFNVEAMFRHTLIPKLGETKVLAELTRGQNMDRGVNYGFAIPVIPANINGAVSDLDELAYWVRVEQDITPWFTLGARYDYYTPSSSEGNNGRDTFGAVAVVHFTKGLQWMLEYDHATENGHLPSTPAPSKHIETISNVLQVRF